MVNTLSFSAPIWVLSSKIYMADLESALHYILRVEVGKFSLLEGQRLVALKKFVAVLAQVSGPRPTSLQLPEGQCTRSPDPLSGARGLAGHQTPRLFWAIMGCCPAASAMLTSPHCQGRPRAGGGGGGQARCPGIF